MLSGKLRNKLGAMGNSREFYSNQAEWCRVRADASVDPDARSYFEHLAKSYEALAESAKQLEQAEKAKALLDKLYRPISD